jgi:hypothetical protein
VRDIRKEFSRMQSIAGGRIPHAAPLTRDDRWLNHILETIWNHYFADVPRVNHVRVDYGAAWKTRLGLITMSEDEATSYIQINSLLRHWDVPDNVTQITVAHEMVHYAHGFGSPLPRRYKHPHRGGIVKRELHRRGLAAEYARYDEWVYERWYDFHAANTVGQRGVSESLEARAVASRLPPD